MLSQSLDTTPASTEVLQFVDEVEKVCMPQFDLCFFGDGGNVVAVADCRSAGDILACLHDESLVDPGSWTVADVAVWLDGKEVTDIVACRLSFFSGLCKDKRHAGADVQKHFSVNLHRQRDGRQSGQTSRHIRRLTDALSTLWWMMSDRLLVYCTGVAR